jgi:hypothetical protein
MTTSPNPLMTQATSMMGNPASQTIPGAPQPQTGQHPVIQAIIKALASGLQGAGYGAMPAQQQMESQQLAAQKAEAMARLGFQQQQLGLEGQRVGIERQRAGTEAESVRQTGEYQRGELAESAKRTKIEEKRSAIEQQRANQEHEAQLNAHNDRASQLEEETRFHKQQGTLEGQRNALAQQANVLAQNRIDMEKDHYEKTLQLQGKQYTRQLAEDERKQLHTSLDEYYKAHPILTDLSGTGPGSIQNMHKSIDDYIDKKIGVGINTGSATSPLEFERKPDGTIGPKVTQGKP